MPKETPTQPQMLVPKLIKFPQDWIERIDGARGDQSFSDFVRQSIGAAIGTEELREMPGGGLAGGRKIWSDLRHIAERRIANS